MDLDKVLLSFIVLMACILFARYLNNKAVKKLSAEKKVELIDLFSSGRMLALFFPLALMVLLYGSMKFNVIPEPYNLYIYFGLIVIYAGVRNYEMHKKLKDNDFEKGFRKEILISSAIRMLGILVAFAILLMF